MTMTHRTLLLVSRAVILCTVLVLSSACTNLSPGGSNNQQGNSTMSIPSGQHAAVLTLAPGQAGKQTAVCNAQQGEVLASGGYYTTADLDIRYSYPSGAAGEAAGP